MNVTELLNVYFYALYDVADQQAHSGLTEGTCEAAVRRNIAFNFNIPRYVTVHRVPDLVSVYDEATGKTMIVDKAKRPEVGQKIECATCKFYAKCTRQPVDGLECCEDWRSKE